MEKNKTKSSKARGDANISHKLESFNENETKINIIAFCCHYCAYTAADLAGSMKLEYPTNIKIIRLPCSGKIDIIYLLKSFESGADGVFVAGCEEGSCHFLEGNIRAKKRVEYAKSLLKEIGIEAERVEMFNLSASQGGKFAKICNDFTEKIKKMGPSPIKKRINQ